MTLELCPVCDQTRLPLRLIFHVYFTMCMHAYSLNQQVIKTTGARSRLIVVGFVVVVVCVCVCVCVLLLLLLLLPLRLFQVAYT